MARRIPEDSELTYVLWRPRHMPRTRCFRRVLVCHSEPSVAESIALHISLRQITCLPASDEATMRAMLAWWVPHAMLLDTRLDASARGSLVGALRADPATASMLIVALSGAGEDTVPVLQRAGYDGHRQRPCVIWRLEDLLETFFRTTI